MQIIAQAPDLEPGDTKEYTDERTEWWYHAPFSSHLCGSEEQAMSQVEFFGGGWIERHTVTTHRKVERIATNTNRSDDE